MTIEGGLEERTIPGLHEALFHLLVRLRRAPASVLDLGAGTGAWANRLVAAGYKVTALERADCGYAGSAPLVEGDLNENFAEPFRSERFDLVTCIEVIEHVENPRHLLRTACRLLAPGAA